MLETTQNTGLFGNKLQGLSYKENSRMAGSIAVWNHDSGSKGTNNSNESGFSFADLLDIINPLQHIPLVNTIYQDITGDEIKSAPQIVGGALFGGPAGAGSALANIIAEEATGQNIMGNVMSLASGNGINIKSHDQIIDHPEDRLNNAMKSINQRKSAINEDLPGSIMSFVDLGGGKRRVYENVNMEESRMAGSMVKISTGVLADNPPREPISKVKLSQWPKYND
jgi:hypothetical protein